MLNKQRRIVVGFTLIELLIVVAIIGILAAIAIPNFLQAQTRARVSRAKADIRTMASACEQYHVDHNDYISGSGYTDLVNTNAWPSTDFLKILTTPVDYLTSLPPRNPFGSFQGYGVDEKSYCYVGGTYFHMQSWSPNWLPAPCGTKAGYIWICEGPSRIYSGYYNLTHGSPSPYVVPYDPTNGTISVGEILFVQGPACDWHAFH